MIMKKICKHIIMKIKRKGHTDYFIWGVLSPNCRQSQEPN